MAEGINEVPSGLTDELDAFLTQLRNNVVSLRSSMAPLAQPANLKCTAQAMSNTIQWTRVPSADSYEVLWNSSPNQNGANVVAVGNSAQWTDNVGQANIKRFYWVRALRSSTGIKSAVSGPVSGTTLAAGTGVTPPVPPPPSNILVVDTATGHVVPYTLVRGTGAGSPGGENIA